MHLPCCAFHIIKGLYCFAVHLVSLLLSYNFCKIWVLSLNILTSIFSSVSGYSSVISISRKTKCQSVNIKLKSFIKIVLVLKTQFLYSNKSSYYQLPFLFDTVFMQLLQQHLYLLTNASKDAKHKEYFLITKKTSARPFVFTLIPSEAFSLCNETQHGTSALSFPSSVFRRKVEIEYEMYWYIRFSFVLIT